MKSISVGAVFVFLLAYPASAGANDYQWIGQITEDGASLSYAIPESDGIKLDFHCDRKTRAIVVNYDHEPAGAKDGAKYDIELSLRGRDAGLRVVVPATGQRLELDDLFVLQGQTRMTPGLRRVLSEGGTLLVKVHGRVEEIPLKGIGAATRQLLAACPI